LTGSEAHILHLTDQTNILQAQMNNYIILTPIIPWPNVTKAAELRQKNRKRRLFIAPQKNMASAPPAFSKQNNK